MNKKIATFCSIAFLLFATTVVFAEDDNGNVDGANTPNLIQKNSMTKNAETLQQVQVRIQQGVNQLKQVRDEAQGKAKEAKDRIQQKLAEIKDQNKQRMAKQIANQFDHLNQTWTDHFIKVLDHLDLVLQKIQARTDKAATNGTDVATVATSIQTAKTAITNARAAVITQAEKTYTISETAIDAGVTSTLTTNGQDRILRNLREQFKGVKSQLQKDLFALRDGAIKDAKISVQGALQELIKIPGVDDSTSTTSPSN